MLRSDPEMLYVTKTLERINKKYSQYGCDIVYLEKPSDIEAYLAQHPEKSKIGFLIKPFPHISLHYSSIYFERTTNNTDSENQKSITEYFLQVDSVPEQHPSGLLRLSFYIRKPSNETTSRLLYYSPFIRQVETMGCMEDAIKILIHCFRESNLTEF